MPFGIDDALIWAPLAGAMAGGLIKKKNPLEGALIGGALGYGGAAMPGLLGAAAETPGAVAAATPGLAVGGEQASMLAAQNAGFGLDGLAKTAAAGGNGLLGAAPAVMGGVKDAGNVMQAASIGKSLMPQPRQDAPIQASPMTQTMPNNSLGQLVASQDQERMQQAQLEQQKRMKRQQQIGGGLL